MFRRIVEDYEASLAPPTGLHGGSGKIERERYGDGSVAFSVRFKGLDVPDDAVVEVRVDGKVVDRVRVRGGAGRHELESVRGHDVPGATTGQTAEIAHDGVVVRAGTFQPD